MNRITLAAAAVLIGAGAAAGALQLPPAPAYGQAAPNAAPRVAPQPGRHIEGRIAYLRTELKITAAQAPQFDRVAAVLRDNAAKMNALAAQRHAARSQDRTAIERLEERAAFTRQMADGTAALVDALKPLYASLSDEQKTTLNDLMSGHRRSGHRGMRL